MKRRILLVDDEVAILLTLKAVLEISGFDVETAASAREAKAKLRSHQYHMIITDMRMENEAAGTDVIQAARSAPYHPAVALLTAFPVDEEGWDGAGPDKILVKATQTRVLLQQIEKLFVAHAAKLAKLSVQAAGEAPAAAPEPAAKSSGSKKSTKSTKSEKPPVKIDSKPATKAKKPAAKSDAVLSGTLESLAASSNRAAAAKPQRSAAKG